jgi:hypothetical protein
MLTAYVSLIAQINLPAHQLHATGAALSLSASSLVKPFAIEG